MTASFKKRNYEQRDAARSDRSSSRTRHEPKLSHGRGADPASRVVRSPNIVLSPVSTNTRHLPSSGKSASYSPRFFMNDARAKQYWHHINSYCNGPADTYGKYLYHNVNQGPVDTVGEMDYLRNNEGPIDSKDEIEFHNRNPGPVDTKGEGLLHTKNAGPIDSIGEGLRINNNAGPIDSKGEIERHNKNPGPVDTKGEGLRLNHNVGPVDAPGETDFKGKKPNVYLHKLPDPPSDDNSHVPSTVPRM
ncbi:MAG: hypothetical protein P1U74_00370 [Legionellaceae bacterium]|nr:hypothetical protein [Legionellaceae bacterium]